MSGAMYPTYNAGKVIGEINWFEPIILKGTVKETYSAIETTDIVIPINRKDINDIFLGYCGKFNSNSAPDIQLNQIVDFVSGQSNVSTMDILGFLKQGEIGAIFSLRPPTSTTDNRYFIFLISEQKNSFVIRLKYSVNSSTAYYVSASFIFGWR